MKSHSKVAVLRQGDINKGIATSPKKLHRGPRNEGHTYGNLVHVTELSLEISRIRADVGAHRWLSTREEMLMSLDPIFTPHSELYSNWH